MENYNQYEEISLVELVVVWLKSWKPAVLSGMLVMFLAVLLVSLLTAKYDSKVQLQIGALSSEQLLQLPEALAAQQMAKYKVGDKAQGLRPLPRLESVTYNKRSGTPIVEFVARAETAEAAAAYLAKVTSSVLLEHELQYQSVKNEHQQLKENLEQYLSDLKVSKSQGGAKEVNVADVLDSINRASNAMDGMQKTRLLSAPSVPVTPSAPKKALLYAMSLICGFAVMFILPFGLAFITSVKEELQRQTEK